MATTQLGMSLLHGFQRVPLARAEPTTWHGELAWVGAAAVVGFAASEMLAERLGLSRSWLVPPYAAVVSPFVAAYVRWSRLDVNALPRWQWRWGVANGVAAGAFLVVAVQNQAGAARRDGARFV